MMAMYSVERVLKNTQRNFQLHTNKTSRDLNALVSVPFYSGFDANLLWPQLNALDSMPIYSPFCSGTMPISLAVFNCPGDS